MNLKGWQLTVSQVIKCLVVSQLQGFLSETDYLRSFQSIFRSDFGMESLAGVTLSSQHREAGAGRQRFFSMAFGLLGIREFHSVSHAFSHLHDTTLNEDGRACSSAINM